MTSHATRVAVVLNGISRKKDYYYRSIHPLLQDGLEVTVMETRHATHARSLAAEGVQQGYQVILAAGGDGTLHQVVNGVLSTGNSSSGVSVGVIPLGTGNDFARFCGIEASALPALIRSGGHPTDVGTVTCTDANGEQHMHYFINVCSLGMGPEVVRRLAGDNRAWGPELTYLKAILSVFFSYPGQAMRFETEDWTTESVYRAAAFANGRTFGHAICVDPNANVNDGLLSAFLVQNMALPKFLFCLARAKQGHKVNLDGVAYKPCKQIQLTAPQPCAIEAEGEWLGWLPATVGVLPSALRFLR